jgi:hypothetical protein
MSFQVYGGESSDEEDNDTISSLATVDWQTAVNHLQRDRSNSLPAEVLQDQAEQLQKALQNENVQPEIQDNREEAFKDMRNNTSPSRPKIGRRWSVQNSSMQDLLYGPDHDKSRDSINSAEATPPKGEERKQSMSTQDLHSLDAETLHRQYAAAALSPLQNQHDMSVSTPSVNQLGGVRPKPSPQPVVSESPLKPEIKGSNEQNTTVTPQIRSSNIRSAFSTGFLNTIQRSASFAKSSGKSSFKHGNTKNLDKSAAAGTKTVNKQAPESSGLKLPGFLNKILSRKRNTKKEKVDKFVYKRKDSSDIDPEADVEDEDDNEISIVHPVREDLVIAPQHDSEDDDDEVLAQELEPDSPNETLREDVTITESDPKVPDRGSFIEEHDGLIFFSFMNAARISPVSTVSSELQVETSKSDKALDTTSDSYDSGSEASAADSVGYRFKRVGLGLHEPIKLLQEIGESKESLSSSASDSENPLKSRVKLSRTESFRMPQRPKPEPDQKFVRGGIYRGSMPVVKRTPPGAKNSPKKDVNVSNVTHDDKRTGIVPQALDLNFIRSTLAQRTTENSSIPEADDTDSGATQQLSKPAPSERKLKKQNTFTPEEVAKVAHHIQGMAKYNQDVSKYQPEAVKYTGTKAMEKSQVSL